MIEDNDMQELKVAKELLENPSLAIKITNFLGTPIEKGLDKLPDNWNEKLSEVTQKALLKSANVAIFTMKDKPGEKSSNILHKLAVATSGGVGGFFGLAALAAELPVSTTIMLRSIADISREYGESITDVDTKLACLEVFAFGGNSDTDDSAETGYFAVRAALAKSVTDAAEFITTRGFVEEGAPVLLKLITKIAERFGIQVTEKVVSQSIPVIGAAAGAIINTMFMAHFQDMAKGHFIVRKLEREYGLETIKRLYKAI